MGTNRAALYHSHQTSCMKLQFLWTDNKDCVDVQASLSLHWAACLTLNAFHADQVCQTRTPAWPYIFVQNETISVVILHLLLIQEGQLLAVTGQYICIWYWLTTDMTRAIKGCLWK